MEFNGSNQSEGGKVFVFLDGKKKPQQKTKLKISLLSYLEQY